ncbi:MAG TPA: helix-turn-helix transcriptional regulator [Coleofasciculaceae cyanobacterium]
MQIEVVVNVELEGLGDRLRDARKGSPKSATQIVAEVGMTTANLNRIENENQKVPIAKALALGAALDLDLTNEKQQIAIELLQFIEEVLGIEPNAIQRK